MTHDNEFDLLALNQCPQKKRSLLSLGPQELGEDITQHTGRGKVEISTEQLKRFKS